LRVSPPSELQPEVERDERMFAHSERLVLPRMTAPAERRRSTTNASCFARTPFSASDPAVVAIRSPVAMLSFTRIGIPCSGPRTLPARRSLSRASAMASASGFTTMTELTFGPPWSILRMRARYCCVSAFDVVLPDAMAFWRSGMEASTTSMAALAAGMKATRIAASASRPWIISARAREG
jgi:hypothetical protein